MSNVSMKFQDYFDAKKASSFYGEKKPIVMKTILAKAHSLVAALINAVGGILTTSAREKYTLAMIVNMVSPRQDGECRLHSADESLRGSIQSHLAYSKSPQAVHKFQHKCKIVLN